MLAVSPDVKDLPLTPRVDARAQYDALTILVRSRRARLVVHPLYEVISDRQTMHTFMESHVFAVWDFMCLLKFLQRRLTRAEEPWWPRGDGATRALINEIVAGEESDRTEDGRYLSHFEMYVEAMEESGADTGPIRRFLRALEDGVAPLEALEHPSVPAPARAFSTATLEMVERGELAEVASAFTLAREAVIPAMFGPLIRRVDREDGVQSRKLRYYFDRHVEIDGGAHGDMARDMLCSICGDSVAAWRMATDAALSALDARQSLWDGIEEQIVSGLSGSSLDAAKQARGRYTDQRVAAVPTEEQAERTNSFFVRLIYILSAVVCAAVAFLILGPRPEALHGQLDVSFLPTVNATLNGTATVLLVAALWFVKRGDIRNHKRAMMTAFGVSAAFLVTYVIYHWFKEGPRPYTGDFRGLYLSILGSHILLSIAVLPLSMFALYRGWFMQVAKHKRIVRWAYPIWLYVSVTGVTIYFMLY